MKMTVTQIRRQAISDLKALAKKFRLQVDTTVYKNSNTKFPFICHVCGYAGETSLALLKIKKYGCKKCGQMTGAEKQRLSPNRIVAEAKKAGIAIILNDYINTNQKVSCRCSECHYEWTTTVGCIRSGRGCPKCRRKLAAKKNSLSETEIKKRLQALGIILLSPYKNSQSKIQVRFKRCGHTVISTWNQIQRGGGCGECAPNKKFVLADYEEIAERFGGKVISVPSTVEENAHWECSAGHRFSRSIRPMLRFDTFCTKCNDGWGESLCRMILEKAFGKTFDRMRPKGLRSPKGIPIELDCFNSELSIALEHQGMHHFKRQVNWQSIEQFKLCRKHDQIKRRYCKENGILLIEIPEVGSITQPEMVPEMIAQQIKDSGRMVPKTLRKIDVSSIKISSRRTQYVNEVRSAAKRQQLELLDAPKLADEKIRVRCKEGHETQKSSRSILQGRECSVCELNRKRKAVRLSDGRVFKSGADAAKALGVSKNTINAAIRRGGSAGGLAAERL